MHTICGGIPRSSRRDRPQRGGRFQGGRRGVASANSSSGIMGGDEAPSIRNATGVAVDLIRTAILEGRIGPGERLKEETIARDLGLSRTPVREALLLLQGEGLVESSRNRGAVVRAY